MSDYDTVRSGVTDRIIPCCWAECDRPGLKAHQLVVPENPQKNLIYLFCSDRHRALYVNSHRSYGNLLSGQRGGGGIVVPDWKGRRRGTA